MDLQEDSGVVSAALTRIGDELGRIEGLRSKNRNTAIIVVGAIIGYTLSQDSTGIILTGNVIGILTAFLMWFQDFQFHKIRHGLQGVDERLMAYIRNLSDKDNLDFMNYQKNDEAKAKFFSRSSSFTFLILVVGPVVVIAYALIWK